MLILFEFKEEINLNLNLIKKLLFTAFKLITLLFAVSVVAFVLVKLSPIDPVTAYIGGGNAITPQHREILEARWGLNETPINQYFSWLSNFLKGDMGDSIVYKQPVIRIIGERFKASVVLMAVAWVISGLFGFILGIIGAYKQNTIVDRLIRAYCLMLQSTPAFWIGMILLLIFGVYLKVCPIGMAVPIGKVVSEVSLGEKIHHMILPTIALSITGISAIALQTREKLIFAMESDYSVFARSRGESMWQFIKRHGIHNILFPAVTLQFAGINELFGGSVLAETVFSYPGLGQATVQAGLKSDIPLLLGITIFTTLFVYGGNMIANILYPVIDPQVREEMKNE